jgi:universal stress protein A
MKRLEKIIVPTDLSDHSRRAIEFGSSLAAEARAALVIMHVANELTAWEFFDDGFGYSGQWPLDRVLAEAALELNRYLEPHLGVLREVPVLTKRIILGAIPGRIIALAEEEKADLIVLSPQRQRGWSWLLSAGITEKVTRMSPCPVLSVTPPMASKQWRGKFLPVSFGWWRPSAESI